MADLQKITPGFPWPAFFAAQGSPPIPSVDVGQPAFFTAVNGMFTSIPIADWRVFLRWRLVHAAAPSLSSPFVNENFAFQRVFSGVTEQLPRWKRCLGSTDDRLGELLGQEYVKENFTPEAKARAVKIVNTLVSELHDRIQHLAWMSAPTTDAGAREALGVREEDRLPRQVEGLLRRSTSRPASTSRTSAPRTSGPPRETGPRSGSRSTAPNGG